MKTKISIFLLSILLSFGLFAQFKYQGKGFVAPTLDETLRPLMYMEAMQSQAESYLDNLIDYTIKIKSTDNIDNQLSEEMTQTYNLLKTYYNKPLAYASVRSELKRIELSIKDKIISYNDRIRKREETYRISVEYYEDAINNYNNNDFINAINKCDEIINLDSKFINVFLLKAMSCLSESQQQGNIYLEKKYANLCIDAINNYINNGGKNLKQAYYIRGYANLNQKNDYSAIVDFRECLKYEFNSDLLFTIARIKDRNKDEGAINDYNEIIKNKNIANPNILSMSYNNKAYFLCKKGEYNEALLLVNEALAIDNSMSFIWDTRGEIYYKMGQYNKCIKDMTKAIEIKTGETSHDNSYYIRGLAYLKLKQRSKGIKDLKESANLGKQEAITWLEENIK